MQKCANKLTNHQLNFASDPSYPLLKQEILATMRNLLHASGEAIKIQTHILGVHGNVKTTSGENHKGLPYVVTDFPQIRGTGFPLVFRSVFWWGKYFSLNVLIHKDHVHPDWMNRLKMLNLPELFVFSGTELWELDSTSPLFQSLTEVSPGFVPQGSHLKITHTFPISEYETLESVPDFYSNIAQACYMNETDSDLKNPK